MLGALKKNQKRCSMKNRILLAVMMAVSGAALAGVSPQNGSFYITCNDIELPAESHGRCHAGP
jgi:hypothetical protein